MIHLLKRIIRPYLKILIYVVQYKSILYLQKMFVSSKDISIYCVIHQLKVIIKARPNNGLF